MPIKRRKRPEPKKPVRKKITKHEFTCRDLYNRLQADDKTVDHNAIMELQKRCGIRNSGLQDTAIQLLSRVSGRVETLQMNCPDNVSYRVFISYVNKDVKPLYGHIYPTLCSAKTSPYFWKSVILAYIEVCKNLGRWV